MITRQAKWMRKTRARLNMLARAYLGGKCVVCGTRENLEFHHKNPAVKSFNIRKVLVAFEDLTAELDKCELRCDDCHKKAHAPKHGTISRYSNKWKCRCDDCVRAWRSYQRAYYQQNLQRDRKSHYRSK